MVRELSNVCIIFPNDTRNFAANRTASAWLELLVCLFYNFSNSRKSSGVEIRDARSHNSLPFIPRYTLDGEPIAPCPNSPVCVWRDIIYRGGQMHVIYT